MCLRKVEPRAVFRLAADERITMLCAAPTVLIVLANAPDEIEGRRAARRARDDGRRAAGGRRRFSASRTELGWDVTQVYGLTETAPFITVCEPRPEHATLPAGERARIKARQGVELITSGELRVVDDGRRRSARATARRSARSSRAATS